ncbi:uncharacterized protein LOC123708342 [Pieris brassicae]|uniref:uncharacterized protein LOC123708342 n=1 Tax=Pieris brassicae TaxID=7116 RepID=UPI001E660B82|nr:uncharacterized protein LOC123708342 [Pieris brassicae]
MTPSTVYKIYEITLHILAIIYVIITGIGTFQFKHDTLVLMANLDKTLVAYNFGLKIFFFVIKRSQLQKLINEIKYSGDKVSEERVKFMSAHIIFITILSTIIVSIFCFLAQYHGEMTVELWVPFDPMDSKINLILANQIAAITFVVPHMYRAFAVQGIVCTLIMYLCDQLDELQERIRSLVHSTDNESAMRVEFTQIIKKHVRLMRYSNTLTNIFKEFFLIQNLAVTIELCLNALMVIVSEGVALAAYQSAWTSWPSDLQRDLLTVIRAAQKPLKLSAGGMATMCIQTYSQALYNAYSIFAVLNDVVE